MDDLEITRLCARAIEVWKTAHEQYPTMTLDSTFSGVEVRGDRVCLVPSNPFRQDPQIYDPLHNRAQALELVERLRLDITSTHSRAAGTRWNVSYVDPEDGANIIEDADPNLLRAICLCAARVQQAREAKQ